MGGDLRGGSGRRRGGLALVGACAVAALFAAAFGAGGGRSQPVAERAASTRSEPAPARGRLGSGKPVKLAFAGDVMFEALADRLASSPASILAPMAPTLKRADIAVVNLETAVTDRGDAAAKEFVFRTPPTAFDALADGGVDVATMANNHGMDYGMPGLVDSLAAARKRKFPLLGIGMDAAQAYRPYLRTVNGQRIAIIGATQVLDDQLISAWSAGPHKPGLASAKDEPRLLAAVRKARASADTVVVVLHWGEELTGCPLARQRSLARRLVAAGADVIVGSHAHILLGGGMLGHALVDYGLGNFVFYASKELTVQTGVLEVTVTGRRVDRYRWVPARISNSMPYPLTGASARQAVASWNALRGCTDLRR